MDEPEPDSAPVVKRILCLNRRGPYGTIYAQEGLEVALIGGAFDQRVALALIDDGVFLLRRGQATEGLGMKRFTAVCGALGDFGIDRIYVERESLAARGMDGSRLMAVPADSGAAESRNLVEVVSARELAGLIAQQDILLNF